MALFLFMSTGAEGPAVASVSIHKVCPKKSKKIINKSENVIQIEQKSDSLHLKFTIHNKYIFHTRVIVGEVKQLREKREKRESESLNLKMKKIEATTGELIAIDW